VDVEELHARAAGGKDDARHDGGPAALGDVGRAHQEIGRDLHRL
jgi:hypothetical protein